MTSKSRNSLDKLQDFANFLLKNRDLLMVKVTLFWIWLQQLIVFLRNLSKPTSWKELWNKLLMMVCALKIRFTVDAKEKRRLLEWVSTKISRGRKPADFTDSWKDGVILCALIEGIVEGSCPRYDLLHQDQAASNLSLALHLIEKNVGIKPALTVEDILNCDSTSERKLLCLISQLKLASAKLRLKSVIQRPFIKLNAVTAIGPKQDCVAKGMGLMLAVKGRKARFSIFLKPGCTMNIVIEIRGPNNTLCSERITNRSPKRRITKEQSQDEAKRKIPFEYNIQPKKIIVSYTPLVEGDHKLSIIWQGQHIMGSPYTISVDDAKNIGTLTPRKNFERPLHRAETDDDLLTRKCKCINKKEMFSNVNLGSVKKRRILRHFVMIDGKEIVIEDSSPEKLTKTIRNFTFGSEDDNHTFTNTKTADDMDIRIDFKGDSQISSVSNENAIKMQHGSISKELADKLNESYQSEDLHCCTAESKETSRVKNENAKDTSKPSLLNVLNTESEKLENNLSSDSDKKSNSNIFQSNLELFVDDFNNVRETSKPESLNDLNNKLNDETSKELQSQSKLDNFEFMEIFNCNIKSLIALKKQSDSENLKVEREENDATNTRLSEESSLIDFSSPIFNPANKSASKNSELFVDEIQSNSLVRKRSKEAIPNHNSSIEHSKRFGRHFENLDVVEAKAYECLSSENNEIKTCEISTNKPTITEVLSTSPDTHKTKNEEDLSELILNENYKRPDHNVSENCARDSEVIDDETKERSLTVKESLESLESIRRDETEKQLPERESFESTEIVPVVEDTKTDFEEEELQFKDLVQTKKQYWEKKLEVKEKLPIKETRKTEGNRINQLKCFWQNISDS